MAAVQNPWPKHWSRPSQAALACCIALAVMLGAGALSPDAERTGGRATAQVGLVDVPDESPAATLAASDAALAGIRARSESDFARALAGVDPLCVESPSRIAWLTIRTQRDLAANGFQLSAFDMLDAIYRQAHDKKVGWSFAALAREYAYGYEKYGAAQAEAAIKNLLVYP